MVFELRFPTEIVFGRGSFDQIGTKTRKYGSKAFLVTGRSAMRRSGVIDKATDLLKASGIEEVYLYDQVEHDPSTETVDRGVELAKRNGSDIVIGIGGGSALDTAKAVACLLKNPGSAEEYQLGKKIEQPGVPFVAVPTTAGTGAEITNNAVITNRQKKLKQSIRSPFMIARVAIVDPNLTTTMPPYVTAATGMDALTQAIEAYVSLASNPVSDALALRSISLIQGNIVRAFRDGDDLSARENMALGSLMSAMAFANAGLGAVHGLAHPIGALFDTAHGVICALLLPYVMEYNLPVRTSKYAQIASAMGHDITRSESEENSARKAIETVRDLLSQFQLPQRLRDIGVRQEDIPIIASSARGSSLDNNPRPTSPESLQEILLSAL